MRNKFVAVGNVSRFKAAIDRAESRAVAEHTIVVVAGDAGLGKSKTAVWWSLQSRAVMIGINPQATPAWALRDLVRELAMSPARSTEQLFLQAVGALAADPRAVVVDEAEHALHRDAAVLDQFRRLADLAEIPLILVGREGTAEKLRRHRQIWRRIAAVAEFQPLSQGDVRMLAEELVEAEIGDDVVAEVRDVNKGRIDGAIRDLAYAETVAKRLGRAVSLADLDTARLGHPWARRDAQLLGLPTRSQSRAAPATAERRKAG